MIKKLLNTICILATLCLLNSFYGIINAINIFNINNFYTVFIAGLLYIVVVTLITSFSYYQKLQNIVITLILGITYSYLTSSIGWFGKWIIITLPFQIINSF